MGLVRAAACLALVAGSVAFGHAGPLGGAEAASAVEDESRTGSTAADLEAQRRLLETLTDTARTAGDELAAAQAQLDAASVAASAALEAYATASQQAVAADLAEERAREELLRARLEADSARRELGEWARESYRSALTGPQSSATLLAILKGVPTDEVASAVQLARAVGQAQTHELDRLAAVEDAQTAAAQAARTTADTAARAAAVAQRAREDRDDAVQQRAAVVADLRERLSRTQADGEQVRQRITALTAELATVAQATQPGAADPSCPGGDLAGYANGQLPTTALCPLYSASGQLLRADAAAAFNRMSQAYEAALGSPICVTDSYRTYPEQVTLYAQKPALAAVPGTSNHGWGTATDLCGGIQNFGTPQHDWLVAHAPAFGWFHPAWARSGGSKPEPWHFEFGG
ncbi:MAG: M15 family metallopeptidase [Kineosporiaceae bacterium]